MNLPRHEEYKDSGVNWLGNIPTQWTTARLKSKVSLITEKASQRTHPVALENIESWSGRFIPTEGDFEGDGIAFVAGDLLFGKLRPYLAKAYLACNSGEAVGDFHVLRPNKTLDSRFFQYQVLNKSFIDITDGSTFGSKMPRASWEFLGNMPLALPSLDEQRIVAAFLDRETAKIDALIAEQEKLIDLLAEKRQATISHAVTRGLDPSAPMKDSGVAWLGEVPAHWKIKRMKHLVREGIAGPYGSSLTKSMYEASGYRVYGQQQVIPDNFSIGDYYISDIKFAEMSRYRVKPDDVLISVMGTIGRAAVVPTDAEPGIINPRLVLYRVINDLIFPRYLQCFLNNSTSQRYFSLAAQGTTMEGLNMVTVGELYVALPPLNEQVEILELIRQEELKINQLLAESARAIALLKERRSALIAAAVTGQIDVRGIAEESTA
ncbi:restriction endonuclease subunit S [Acidovorax sp. NCPPB 2350]|nr:restriction endonuclease subunit S [Acidovorax sp. NCPPB 2350]